MPPDKSSGHRTQQIDIHYNFIGEIGLSHAIDKRNRRDMPIAHHTDLPKHEHHMNTPLIGALLFSIP